MKYTKLVRDNIPEIITAKGGAPITYIANEDEYWKKLKEKLNEEVEEFMNSEHKEEIADILEVIEAICKEKRFEATDVNEIKIKKAQEKGKFIKRIILEES